MPYKVKCFFVRIFNASPEMFTHMVTGDHEQKTENYFRQGH